MFYFKYFKVKRNKMVAAVNFGCAFGFTIPQAVVTSTLEYGMESNGRGEKINHLSRRY